MSLSARLAALAAQEHPLRGADHARWLRTLTEVELTEYGRLVVAVLDAGAPALEPACQRFPALAGYAIRFAAWQATFGGPGGGGGS